MHRTEGARTVTIGSLPKQHQNQDLPLVGGSTLSAEYANALGEELINIIQYAGITIKSNSVSDRAEGFTQTREAIFNSKAITAAAIANNTLTSDLINEVSLTKLSAGICDITTELGSSDITADLVLRSSAEGSGPSMQLKYTDDSGSPKEERYSLLNSTGLEIRDEEDDAITRRLYIKDNGLQFYQSDKNVMILALDFDGATWSDVGGGFYEGTLTTDLLIADTEILGSSFKYTYTSTLRIAYNTDAVVSITYSDAGGGDAGKWRITVRTTANFGGASYTDFVIMLFCTLA